MYFVEWWCAPNVSRAYNRNIHEWSSFAHTYNRPPRRHSRLRANSWRPRYINCHMEEGEVVHGVSLANRTSELHASAGGSVWTNILQLQCVARNDEDRGARTNDLKTAFQVQNYLAQTRPHMTIIRIIWIKKIYLMSLNVDLCSPKIFYYLFII